MASGKDIKKRAERNAEIRRSISKIETTLAKLERTKSEYMEKAVAAKERGDCASYNIARTAINISLAQIKRAKEMLLNIRIMTELQKTCEINADFLTGMSTISKQISKINKKSDFVKLQKEIEKALSGMEEAQVKIDGFLQNTEAQFSAISSVKGALSDSQLDELIGGDVTEKELLTDAEIERVLEDLKSEKTETLVADPVDRKGGEKV